MMHTLRLDPTTAELEQVKGGCEIAFPVSIYLASDRLGAVTIHSVEELIEYVRENGGRNFGDTELVAYVRAFCASAGIEATLQRRRGGGDIFQAMGYAV
ncbi:hypothetical protein [Jannaschia sp. M317]|uniref:hypothetical protein n=1 Tax=Jannaschia sp. M317 TaxID=2867011 RepID=UPI0021A64A80|nr:hypothetical protein [Jannaschia sp. M317]UWQ17075.1 hypothetical protein K3551_14440 [Jannaschia sp. M317]